MLRSRRESAGAMAKLATTEMAVQAARILRKINMTAVDSEDVVACWRGRLFASSIAIGTPR